MVQQKAETRSKIELNPMLEGGWDLVCFSHLRWDHVFQRPQHLMTRFASERRVYYFEEPRVDSGPERLEKYQDKSGVWVLTPHLEGIPSQEEYWAAVRSLIDPFLAEQQVEQFVSWYYTPMPIAYTDHLKPEVIVYDCMDELSAFHGAPPVMLEREARLLKLADLVFAGGQSLYEAKIEKHADVHAFPSSIDVAHFSKARRPAKDPADQAKIPHPRIGYFGVIDERVDLGLIGALADARPDWHIVMVGPVTKIDESQLPQRKNVHYLGKKSYEELPKYLAGWDIAMMPFAQNEATRFISPTKTPEYLAGGRPVVSTPIRDVVRPYGEQGLVWIADTVAQFVNAIEAGLNINGSKDPWLKRVDQFLAHMSWDRTWMGMKALIENRLEAGEEDESVDITDISALTGEESISLSPIPFTQQRRRNGSSGGFDYLIVGAGFAGSVLAERLAVGSGKKVLLIDRRMHIGGNAYDHYDEAGILVHKYGPHIFHTNSKEVFAYLSRFTEWRPYEHRVRASVDGQLLPIPINLDTVNHMYGLNLTSMELEDFFASLAEPVEKVRTSEDVVVSKIGRQLYEKFFRNYTRKQWGLDPSELDATVTSRVPIRMNRDDRYFGDIYQAMPQRGYTRMFENLLDHPNIHILLNTDFAEIRDMVPYREVIFTGPVDEYFDYIYGELPYRSLHFKFVTLEEEYHQPVAVVNYPNEHPYTRVTEFKHLTGQLHPKTTLVYEYPCSEGDPYYPIPRAENAELYKKYKALADSVEGVHFAGRLGTYRYYNMDQVTGQALTLYARLAGLDRSQSISTFTPNRFTIDLPCSLMVPEEVSAIS